MLTTVYQSPFLQIHYSSSQHFGVLEWNGCIPSDVYRAESERLLEMSKEKDIRYWLSDTRGMCPVLLADKNWLCRD